MRELAVYITIKATVAVQDDSLLEGEVLDILAQDAKHSMWCGGDGIDITNSLLYNLSTDDPYPE